MSGEIEKIEVAKSNGRFYYTGVLTKDRDEPEWVVIETTRGETLKYRKGTNHAKKYYKITFKKNQKL